MERRNQNEETSIIPVMDIPMMDIAQLKELTDYVAKVKKTLMTEDKDYIVTNNKQYTTRSGFAKLAQGFNLSDEIVQEQKVYKNDEFYGFDFTVRVYNAYGRQATGVGSCTIDEPNLIKHKERPYHDCRSIAYTRAWNRAVSNFVGSADVSAEEMSLGEDFKPEERGERKGIDLPEGFSNPEWNFIQRVGQQSWEDVDSVITEWIRDSGLSPVDVFEVPESDAMRAWLRPKAYLGDNFGRVAKMLNGAGFKWRPTEKRFVLMKPEGS